MSKDVIYFAENICGIKLADWQKDLLRQTQEANDKGELILVNLGRRQGGQLLNNILINFQIWSKTQQISDLEAKLAESEKKNFELIAKLNLKEHRPAFCTLADRECEEFGKVEELKQQLADIQQEQVAEMQEHQEAMQMADKTIKELEKQLLDTETQNKRVLEKLELIVSANQEMQQQLAEKTLTIEQINKAFIENRSLWKGKYEKANQDKISFAIEQLEKVKEKMLSYEEILDWFQKVKDQIQGVENE